MKLPSSRTWSARFGVIALASAATILFSSGLAFGQGTGYSTTFDNDTPGETLSGQDGWNTNDPQQVGVTGTGEGIGQSDYVGTIGGYSSPASDYWAALGGVERGSGGEVAGMDPDYLYNTFSLAGSSAYSFNVDFGISSSNSTYPNRDTFNWTFQNSVGSNLFSVDLVPVGGGSSTTNAVRYSINGVQSSTGNGILENAIYHLTVNVNVTAKTFSIILTPTGGSALTLASNVSLGSIDPSTVTDVAATWNITNTTTDNGGYTGSGSNALIFNNYAVTVPEPSAWGLIILGAAGLTVVLRRRLQA